MQVMQSNEWTFSLKILVVILALALVAPSVMAGEFGVSLSVVNSGGTARPDVAHGGDYEVQAANPTIVLAKFDRGVTAADFTSAKVTASTYDKDGKWLLNPSATVAALAGSTGGTSWTVSIPTADGTSKLIVKIEKDIPSADPENPDKSKEVKQTFNLLAANPSGTPTVYRMEQTLEPLATVTAPTFGVYVILSENPKDGLNKDLIEVGEGAVESVAKLASLPSVPNRDLNGDGDTDDDVGETDTQMNATWRDGMAVAYLVTIKPKTGDKTVTIKIKNFDGMEMPAPGSLQEVYSRPTTLIENRHKLTVKTNVKGPDPKDKLAGFEVNVDHDKGTMIPASGYLLLTKDMGVSGIAFSDKEKEENKKDKQSPAQLMFNTRNAGLPNLETFLANGGTIDVTTTTGAAMGSVVISEIMWGSDASQNDSTKSQWIELHNTTASAIAIGDKNWKLKFYGANEDLPTTGYIDRVGTRTLNADGTTLVFWSTQGKGMSGRTNNPGTGGTVVPTVATSPLVSMQRAMMADGTFANGTVAGNWTASVAPAVNFKPSIEGSYVGTPGAKPASTYTPPAPPPAPTPVPATPLATAADIGITEIMVDTGGGKFPQWIELTNLSSAAVRLSGWSAVIDNAADADVHGGGAPITVSLGDAELGVGSGVGNGNGQGQSLLLVAWAARNSANFNADRVINLGTQLKEPGRYQLLSYKGFKISLIPEQTSPVLASGDEVGNLGEGWDLPMAEGRSSIIRRETGGAGITADGWKLASMTDLVKGPTSWYGDDEDAGTPGYDSGGPLPVELSMFYPARDRLTGAVVITWETQSELNNAGFFIKRSEARNGKFTVINPQMIAGAGTTSEKQSYTYTDTSAKPNVVYYYQIEDVSLDGQRQLLTIGTRLRGHIGAAGKATTKWGELKSQE